MKNSRNYIGRNYIGIVSQDALRSYVHHLLEDLPAEFLQQVEDTYQIRKALQNRVFTKELLEVV